MIDSGLIEVLHDKNMDKNRDKDMKQHRKKEAKKKSALDKATKQRKHQVVIRSFCAFDII